MHVACADRARIEPDRRGDLAVRRPRQPHRQDRAVGPAELRRLGRTIYRRSGASGLESLTARELEIARLVVDRQTNTQIAATLFLSKKTVETHLRNIFGKVGVSSRVELARAVERSDRAT